MEVGSWKGSSLVAALYGNPCCAGLAIENWSEFGSPREEFMANLVRWLPAAWLRFVEEDFFKVDVGDSYPGMFNIYFYDGAHTREAQKQAITHAWPALADASIIVVDDWNWRDVRAGTLEGLAQVGARVSFQAEVRHTWDNSHTPVEAAEQAYWNGMGVFVVAKG